MEFIINVYKVKNGWVSENDYLGIHEYKLAHELIAGSTQLALKYLKDHGLDDKPEIKIRFPSKKVHG